jgi:acyl dehydratase
MPAEHLPATTAAPPLREATRQLTAVKGTMLPVPEPIVITQPEEDAFAALIGDWDPMHNDPGWRQTDSRGPIVLGVHMLARAEDFVRACAPLRDAIGGLDMLTLGIEGVRFPSPFPVGAPAHVEITVTDVTDRGDSVLLTTAQQCAIDGASKPTMVARHMALLTARANITAAPVPPTKEYIDLAGIPAGIAVPAVADHDAGFFTSLAGRSGEWLGTTLWTSISDREAHAFALLCGTTSYDQAMAARAHPFAGRPLQRLHLLALRAYFSPQVGLPVLTDESMMAFNYGVDSARWYADVFPGTRLRDHVQLRAVQPRRSGDYLVTTRHALEAEGNPDAVLVADCKTLYRTTT